MNDNDENIVDAEFEVIEGPYQAVEPDPYPQLKWWQKAAAESAGLVTFVVLLAVVIIIARLFGNAVGDFMDAILPGR